MEVNSSVTEDNGLEPYPGDKLRGVTQTLIMTLVTILIIVGNLTNIVVISQSLKAFSITGHFMISLAFADLGESIYLIRMCVGVTMLFGNTRYIFTSNGLLPIYLYLSSINSARCTSSCSTPKRVGVLITPLYIVMFDTGRCGRADHAAVYRHV